MHSKYIFLSVTSLFIFFIVGFKSNFSFNVFRGMEFFMFCALRVLF